MWPPILFEISAPFHYSLSTSDSPLSSARFSVDFASFSCVLRACCVRTTSALMWGFLFVWLKLKTRWHNSHRFKLKRDCIDFWDSWTRAFGFVYVSLNNNQSCRFIYYLIIYLFHLSFFFHMCPLFRIVIPLSQSIYPWCPFELSSVFFPQMSFLSRVEIRVSCRTGECDAGVMTNRNLRQRTNSIELSGKKTWPKSQSFYLHIHPVFFPLHQSTIVLIYTHNKNMPIQL